MEPLRAAGWCARLSPGAQMGAGQAQVEASQRGKASLVH